MTVVRRWQGHHQATLGKSSGNHLHKPNEGALARPNLDEIADALLNYASGRDDPRLTTNVVTFATPESVRGESRSAGSGDAALMEATKRPPTAQRPLMHPRRPAAPAMHLGPMVQEVPKAKAGPAGESSQPKYDIFDVDKNLSRRTPGPYRHGAPVLADAARPLPEQSRFLNRGLRPGRETSRLPPAARAEPETGAPVLFRQAAVSDEDEMRRRRMAVYFGKRPLWTTFSLFAGGVLIFNPSQYHPIYGFELTLDRAFFVGLAILLIGLYFRYMRVQRPTDEEVDEWTLDDLQGAEARALELTDVDGREVISEPVVLTGFPDIDRISSTFRNSLYGKDNVLRFTPRAITVFRFTKDVAVTYEGATDLVTGQFVYEKTSEFFYRDIASVGLQKSVIPPDLGFFVHLRNKLAPRQWAVVDRLNQIISRRPSDTAVQRNMREVFQIRLIDGETINVVLRDGRFAGRRICDEISVTSDDRIIRAVREFVAKMKNEQLCGRAVQRSDTES